MDDEQPKYTPYLIRIPTDQREKLKEAVASKHGIYKYLNTEADIIRNSIAEFLEKYPTKREI